MSSARIVNMLRIAALAFVAVAPLLLNAYWLFLILQVIIFAYLALSFDVAYSYSRLLSFCQGLFFGISAYIAVYAASPEPWGLFAMVIGGTVTAALCGAVIGLMLVRMQGHGAVIATVIIAAAALLVGNALNSITGGDDGRSLASTTIGVMQWQLQAGLNKGTYYLAALPLACIIIVLWRLRGTMMWTVVRAVAQNDVRARLLGYNVELRRYIVFIVSASIAGFGGALYALAMRQVTTGVLEIGMSVNAILFAVVGGLGTDFGALIGALILLPATELIAVFFVHVQILIGSLMAFVAVMVPKGIVGTLLNRAANASTSTDSANDVTGMRDAPDDVGPVGRAAGAASS